MWDLTVTLDTGRRVMVCMLEAFFILFAPHDMTESTNHQTPLTFHSLVSLRNQPSSQSNTSYNTSCTSASFSHQYVSHISILLASASFSHQHAYHINMLIILACRYNNRNPNEQIKHNVMKMVWIYLIEVRCGNGSSLQSHCLTYPELYSSSSFVSTTAWSH